MVRFALLAKGESATARISPDERALLNSFLKPYSVAKSCFLKNAGLLFIFIN